MLGVCLKYTQHNYGSKLQALATVYVFEKMGIEYEIIRYNKRTVSFYVRSLPRVFNFVFLNDRYDEIQKRWEIKKHPEIEKNLIKRQEAFDSFDIHFEKHLSKVYDSYRKLKKACNKNYYNVITCSDQLWSPSALASGFYNLMFVPNKTNKVSWASSFGVSNIPFYQIRRTRKYLRRIEHISMREKRGAEIVKELTGRNVPILLDPVFALTRQEWDSIVPYRKEDVPQYIFCYFLGDNKEHREAAINLAKTTGLKIVTLRHLDRVVLSDESFGDVAPYDVDPAKFLNILRDATFVCTDSFHGTAFSILYEKKFVVFNRYNNKSSNSKNSRIDSICEILNLTTRRYVSGHDIAECMLQEIDYCNVLNIIASYRRDTMEYLRSALNVE